MIKEDQDQDQVHFPLSTMISYDHTSASAVPCPNLQNSQYGQGVQLSQQNHQSNGRGGSSVQLLFNSTEPAAAVDRSTREEAALPAVKWMSSKMRLMRKMMMGEDDQIIIGKQGSSSSHRRRRGLQDHQAQSTNPAECSTSSSNGIIIRVCSNCSTTKTPLWRSGPQGPKSLCNACGIRQMKARRAMRAAGAAAASAAASGGVVAPATAPKKASTAKEERLEVDRTVPFKKRFKIVSTSTSTTTTSSSSSSTGQKKLCFDDITISLSKKLAFNQTTFPQEEKDAAILLMALSFC